jgi:NTP pyrophosphatase (non-canonical NTP hydrolase)
MNEHDHAILKDAVTTWGTQAQLVMTLEECAELSKEVAKTIRTKKVTEGLADEIADVELMLAQLRLIAAELGDTKLDQRVVERRAFKIERLRTRLADWKRDHA